ncbi:MAG: hypothetical protein PWQ64_1570, partial [Desulfomicrobiaceae bacterium]|nr:hypothetical protein [Desulfomicrobiaceae bacterium]
MQQRRIWPWVAALLGVALLGGLAPAWAAGGDLHHAAEEIGKELGALWVIPFACML